jgi:hypothetical protein
MDRDEKNVELDRERRSRADLVALRPHWEGEPDTLSACIEKPVKRNN